MMFKNRCFGGRKFKWNKRGYSKVSQSKPADVYANPEPEYTVLPYPERAKSLVQLRISAVLSTLSKNLRASVPLYGSRLPYVLDKYRPGVPIVALRRGDKHSENLKTHQNVSLLVTPLLPKDCDPSELPTPRLNMTAQCEEIIGSEWIQRAIDRYDEVHPGIREIFEEKNDFQFYYIIPDSLYYQLSTGKMELVEPEQYYKASVDPIMVNCRPLLERYNAIPDFCKKIILDFEQIEAEKSLIYSMDRYGFDMLCLDGEEWMEFRFPLEKEITDIDTYEEMIKSLVKD